jgi:ABC-type dipeptide/oligopeptide/nickel transport system permease subunit
VYSTDRHRNNLGRALSDLAWLNARNDFVIAPAETSIRIVCGTTVAGFMGGRDFETRRFLSMGMTFMVAAFGHCWMIR